MFKPPLTDGRASLPWIRLMDELIEESDWWVSLAHDRLLDFAGEVTADQWQIRELDERARWLVAQLGECIDPLPDGSTYGQAILKLASQEQEVIERRPYFSNVRDAFNL